MKFLKEICIDPEVECKEYKVKRTARAILMNDNNEIALLHATNGDWYELVGGKLEENDTHEKALKRECLEEVGAKIEILDEVGVVIEFRNTFKTIKINHCYCAKILGKLGQQSLTESENEYGIVLEFHTIENAIALIKSTKPFGENEMVGKYMLASEIIFLEEYLNRE